MEIDSLELGDDGTGHCRGCGVAFADDEFTDGCVVCAAAFAIIMGWGPDSDQ